MNDLIEEFNELQEEFHETIEEYPILEEDFDKIFDDDIKEIEELVDRNDEYYLKKACSKLYDLTKNIKEMSQDIKNIFNKYDLLTKKWNAIEIDASIDQNLLDKVNKQVKKSNQLITSKNYKDVKEAYKLLNESIKELKDYIK